MLTIEVKRHDQGEDYFAPWIEEHDGGCTYHVHHEDISDEGAQYLSGLITQQVRRRWRPRPPGAPAGRCMPVIWHRCPMLDDREVVAVDDRPDLLAYTVRADLITERGARGIARAQERLTARWVRLTSRRRPQTV
ncbi:hypothetical protein ABZX68_06350 [Streptomyces cellulosae]